MTAIVQQPLIMRSYVGKNFLLNYYGYAYRDVAMQRLYTPHQ
ncbi:MAG: hypothetical protein V7K50_02795 [Nostoc sp.]